MFWDMKHEKHLTEDKILSELGHPDWVSGVLLSENGDITLILEADPDNLEASEVRRIEVETRLIGLKGVKHVKTVLTSERPPSAGTPDAHPHSPAKTRAQQGRTARLSDEARQSGQTGPAKIADIEGISRILVVASAKGGVGKSTVSVNLAAVFAQQGLRVGLLDADIYGPSVPTMLGVAERSPKTGPDGKLIPIEAHGIHSLSIGYLTDPETPMIWRGPMVQSAIRQMLHDVRWGSRDDPLDLLIIDTPPGTGEAQLTLAQSVPVSAAVIVTTPQTVALADVRRGAAMFERTHVPILGLIETMSWFDTAPGARHYPFGRGGAKQMAAELGLPVLAELPLIEAIRTGGDQGQPAAVQHQAARDPFFELARQIAFDLDALKNRAPPEIIFE